VSSPAIVHLFYDVFMGWGHASLTEMMANATGKAALERGEVAVFLNRSWTACKILAPGNVMLYFRSQGQPITAQMLKTLPTVLGSPRFGFSKNLEANFLKAFEERFKVKAQRLKVAYA
jgi:hypothetical protein